jgi:hypothetical protein
MPKSSLKREVLEMEVLHRLPIPGEGCQNMYLYTIGSVVVALFSYQTGPKFSFGTVEFERTLTLNYSAEPVAILQDNAYDSIVRISPSEWLDNTLSRKVRTEDPRQFHHFSVYFSNCGSLDVVAKRFKVEEEVSRDVLLEVLAERLRSHP